MSKRPPSSTTPLQGYCPRPAKVGWPPQPQCPTMLVDYALQYAAPVSLSPEGFDINLAEEPRLLLWIKGVREVGASTTYDTCAPSPCRSDSLVRSTSGFVLVGFLKKTTNVLEADGVRK
mmetsp:Transcript_32393/g.59231  ORF Transcript_32393/g.59231 Transcript_32393/m.59231 type:complete len:119 (-) Transcript_32393:477-833(-)